MRSLEYLAVPENKEVLKVVEDVLKGTLSCQSWNILSKRKTIMIEFIT